MGPVYDGIARILFGETSQTVVHIPPVRVSSATFTIQDLTRDEDASDRVIGTADSAATLDSYSQSTTAAAGPAQTDPRKVSVSTSGITVGNVYQLTDTTDGVTQYVTVAGTGSGYVKLAAPLMRSYGSGSTLAGVQLSASFPDATAANEDFINEDRPLAIRWEYTLFGRKRIHDQQVRIVRRTNSDVDEARIEEWVKSDWPDLYKEMPDDQDALRRWIRSAYRRVEARMLSANTDPTKFMAGPQGNELIYLRTLLHMADQGLHPASRDPDLFREERKREYAAAWNELMGGTPGKNTADIQNDTNAATGLQGTRYRPAFGIS